MAQECGNPLLLAWLKEWWDDAREKNSKGVLTYKKAYESMKACPIAFNHPSEATQLYGLGPKLCDRLTAKLEAHCQENGLPMPEPPNKARKRAGGETDADASTETTKKARKSKPYVPALRSGPYAIIIALSSISEQSAVGLTKSETIDLAQEHCDSSFTAPSDPTKFYTAWNSMKTLQNKDLVYESGRPTKRYALTEEGWETAKRIRKANGLDMSALLADKPSNSAMRETASTSRPGRLGARTLDLTDIPEFEDADLPGHSDFDRASRSPTRQELRGVAKDFSPVQIPAGAFTVELILDNREVRAKTDQSYIQNTLVDRDVVPMTRALPLGDALWVARVKPEFAHLLASATAEAINGPTEVMLGHIVERKRLDDLIGSIKDGRFHEQKFRLRRSGIPNVAYVIEDIALAPDVAQRTAEMVNSAITGTMVVDGFFVKRTRKLDETIAYLARVTKMLRARYEKQGLSVVPSHALGDGRDITGIRALLQDEKRFLTFDTFAALAGKSDSLTLRDVFLKMLMCTKGITGDKALEIQRRWKTPRAFIEALQAEEEGSRNIEGEGSRRRREMVFRSAGHLVGRRKIGKAVSGKVADVWGQA